MYYSSFSFHCVWWFVNNIYMFYLICLTSNVLENEDQTPIPSLDNTFVEHTSDYKTQLVNSIIYFSY
ncbi:unnamed protein product [Brassica napus]|uniref:(rape) hypothetical protein n=1 Tax=Brassica napus TaxID=3708 RepID=A0A816TLV4_BRANA|nr:unnamed protein product [Brassica napus]